MKKLNKKVLIALLSATLIESNISMLSAVNRKTIDSTIVADELSDFDKLNDHSSGWKKVTDNPSDFFGDSDRLIRTEDTVQNLVYQLSGLTDFKLRMHSYLRSLHYLVDIYTSDDLVDWTKVEYNISSAKTSDSAFWGTFDIMPKDKLDGSHQYLKIEVKNNPNANQTKTVKGSDTVDFLTAVQIGKVELTDNSDGLITNTNRDVGAIKVQNFDANPKILNIDETLDVELLNPTQYDVRIESSNPKVLKYENNEIKGVSNGTAYLKGIIAGEVEVFKYEVKVGTGVNLDIGPQSTKPTSDTGDNTYFKQASGDNVNNVITIDPNNIVVKDYMGGAMELEIVEWFDMDDARWDRYFERIKYMDLGYVRCMLAAYWYCTGFDADNNPVYIWDCLNADGTPKYYSRSGAPVDTLGNNIEPNIKRMKRLYSLFDFFQKNNITVMTGEWQYPEASEWYYVSGEYLKEYDLTLDDPRYAKVAAGFVEHMVKDKKYTCIEQYDLGNEVNINPDSYKYDAWKQGNLNLFDELKKRGLEDKVSLTPDLSYWKGLWYNESIKDLKDVFKQYEFHWYVNEVNLKNGVFENEMRLLVNNAAGQDNKDKKVYMGEVGMRDMLNGLDQVTNIDSFDYGLWMSNILVQGTRAGMSGLAAWSLDDAVHINGPMTYDYSVDDKSLMKIWGLWNSLGEYQGKSEDIRPWYVPWALASKFMPRNSQIVYTNSLKEQVYSTAAIHNDDLTVSVVNHSGKAQQVLVKVPEASKNVDLSVYAYFKDNLGQDKNGYPVRSGFKKNINLQEGVVLTLPANGNIILTTMEGENKFNSDDNGYLSDSMQSLQNVKDYKNIGFNSYEKHPNDAGGRIEMNQTLFGDVTRINRASNDSSYVTYQRDGGVKNFRIHSYAKGSVINNIKVYGSQDNKSFEEITLSETNKYSLSSGWKFGVLTPKQDISYKYIKVELLNTLKSTEIQIGKVELTSRNSFNEELVLELPSGAESSEYKKVKSTLNLVKDSSKNIYSINGFTNLPEGFTLKSIDETIAKVTNDTITALKTGSTIVNVYKDKEIIGTVVVNIYTFHDEIKEGNGLTHSVNNMKYDNMADASDSTFSRTAINGNVTYQLKGIHDFVIRGYSADNTDKYLAQIKVYGSKDGVTWSAITTKTEDIQPLSNPYWRTGSIVPSEAIVADYDYIKIAVEGALTDDWKVQVGDVIIQDQLFKDVTVNKIELDKKELELSLGEKKSIIAKTYPEIVFPFEVEYSSSNPKIATIDDKGVIIAIAKGETKVKVYAKDNPEIYQECTVTVLSSEDSSKEVAENIKELSITNNKVNLPVIAGYTMTISQSSQPNVIGLDGIVKPTNKEESVQLIVAVKNNQTGVVSYTESITVKVPQKVDKTELTHLMNKVKKVDESKYTVDSYKVLTQAISSAQKVIDNNQATQKQVNDAYKTLKSAYDSLKLKPVIDVPEKEDVIVNNSDKSITITGQLPKDIELSSSILNSKELNVLSEKIKKVNPEFATSANLEKVYQLDLLLKGQKFDLDGSVKVSLKLDNNLKDKNLGIIYIDEKGNIQKIDSTVENGYITFHVTHFSTYGIVSYNHPTKPEGNGPQTHDTASVYMYGMIALISLAGLCIITKKKKSK